MLNKSFQGELLKADQSTGEVIAVFSRFNVIDSDGDVTVPGAFEQGAKTRVSAYNHGSSRGMALPVGKGVITQDLEKATATMQFFMDTTGGRETFEVVKALGEDGQWSYNYDILDAERGEFKGQRVQYLKELKVHEVSPVLVGAGVGTQTVFAKDLKALTDDELAEEAERAFKALHDRGLAIPETLATAVRVADAAVAELKRRNDTVRGIALRHGLSHEGVTV